MLDYVRQYDLYKGSDEWHAAVKEEAKNIPKHRAKKKIKFEEEEGDNYPEELKEEEVTKNPEQYYYRIVKAALAVLAYRYDIDDEEQAQKDQWNKALRKKVVR